MKDALPQIQALDNCTDREQRAAWLLRCPRAVLLCCEMTIRNRLMTADFREGIDYLETEIADLGAVRREDGSSFNDMNVRTARGRMLRIVLGLPPR